MMTYTKATGMIYPLSWFRIEKIVFEIIMVVSLFLGIVTIGYASGVHSNVPVKVTNNRANAYSGFTLAAIEQEILKWDSNYKIDNETKIAQLDSLFNLCKHDNEEEIICLYVNNALMSNYLFDVAIPGAFDGMLTSVFADLAKNSVPASAIAHSNPNPITNTTISCQSYEQV